MSGHGNQGDTLRPLVPPAVYLAATLLITFPLWTDPAGLFIDGEFQWSQIWGTGVVAHAFSNGSLPLQTDWLDWPTGGRLVLVGWTTHLLAVLLDLALPLVAAFNIAVLLHLWMAPYAAFLLFRRLAGSERGALAGGLVFGFSPFVLHVIHLGQLDQYSHVWIPAFLLCLLRALERLGAWRLVLLGLASAGLVFSSPYAALFCTLLALGLSAREAVSSWSAGRLRMLARVAAAGVVSALPAIPAYLYFNNIENSLLRAPMPHDIEEQVEGVLPSLGRLWNTELVGQWFPHSAQSITVTLSLASLLLGLYALLGPFRKRTAWWLGLWLLFMILAMGKTITVFGYEVRLPLYYLCQVLPFFIRMKSTYRFMVMVFLASGVLASLGTAGLLRRLSPRAQLPALAAVCALLVFEPLQPGEDTPPFPLPVVQAAAPRVYHDLAQQPVPGRLIEFPCQLTMDGPRTALNQRQMFYQTVHRWPMGNLDKDHLRSAKAFRNPALRVLSTLCMRGNCSVGHEEREGAHRLAEAGFTTLLFHQYALVPRARRAARRYLDELFEVVREYPDDRIVRYRFPRP